MLFFIRFDVVVFCGKQEVVGGNITVRKKPLLLSGEKSADCSPHTVVICQQEEVRRIQTWGWQKYCSTVSASALVESDMMHFYISVILICLLSINNKRTTLICWWSFRDFPSQMSGEVFRGGGDQTAAAPETQRMDVLWKAFNTSWFVTFVTLGQIKYWKKTTRVKPKYTLKIMIWFLEGKDPRNAACFNT